MFFTGEVDTTRYNGKVDTALSNLHSADASAQATSGMSVKGVRTNSGIVPMVSDPETLLNFAKMSANSYKRRSMDGWRNMTDDYTGLDGFGWDQNGLRGHIYANAAQSLVIIGFKGTSTLWMGGGTVGMDKYVDNVMFSCCCARVDIAWIPICGCYAGASLGADGVGVEEEVNVHKSSGRCNQTCLLETVRYDNQLYYHQAIRIVERVRQNYPRAILWFTGHSLGGAIASLMAVTFADTAAVTFEAPGDKLYADRISLPRSTTTNPHPIYHIGITTDPIFMGTCQGPSTSCYLSGYAMETRCRHGHDCVIDLGNAQDKFDVTTHRIDWLIDNVLQGQYRMPQCKPVVNCTDCEGWQFV